MTPERRVPVVRVMGQRGRPRAPLATGPIRLPQPALRAFPKLAGLDGRRT